MKVTSNEGISMNIIQYLRSQIEAPWVAEFRSKLDLIIGEFMTDLTVLAANEEKLIDAVEVLLASSKQAQADLAQAKIDLAAALAANDPAAAQAVQDQIDAIAKALGDEAAKIEAPAADVPAPAPDAT